MLVNRYLLYQPLPPPFNLHLPLPLYQGKCPTLTMKENISGRLSVWSRPLHYQQPFCKITRKKWHFFLWISGKKKTIFKIECVRNSFPFNYYSSNFYIQIIERKFKGKLWKRCRRRRVCEKRRKRVKNCQKKRRKIDENIFSKFNFLKKNLEILLYHSSKTKEKHKRKTKENIQLIKKN